MFLGGREDVDDAAAHGDLATVRDQVDPRVADLDEPDEHIVELARLAGLQLDRLEVAEPGHDRLQQAPDRRGHHLQRPVRLTRVRGMGEPPQHRDALADGVGPRRQPLVRQRLPAREARHAVGGQERTQPVDQVVRLTGRRRDRQHEAASLGQRRGQHRPQRRRRDQVRPGRVFGGGAVCRPGDQVVQPGVIVESSEQSCEAHDVLVIGVRPVSRLPSACRPARIAGYPVPGSMNWPGSS